MEFIHQTDLEYSKADHALWMKRMQIGQWIRSYVEPIRECIRVNRIAAAALGRVNGNRLSAEQIQELTDYLCEIKDVEIRRDYFARTEFDKTFGSIALNLVVSVLERFNSVRTVVNIGAYYACVDYALATRFPDVKFKAVDFIPDYEQYNSEFTAPNLSFISGYPMDLIESGRLTSDLTLFAATAAEIVNPELRRYFQLLSTSTKYLILSEPLYNMPDGGVVDPLSVSPHASLPAYAQPEYLPHRKGPIAYIHNYRSILAELGFVILHYRAFKPAFTDIRWIEVVAATVD